MRSQFTESLENFTNNLTLMGNMVNESLHKAMMAYNNKDINLAREVINDDLRINALQVDIEQDAYRLIALQQPVTSDLRLVFAVLLASSDLERIADHGVDIAKSVIRGIEEVEGLEPIDEMINQMYTIVKQMVEEVVTAFMNQDADQAREIAKRDSQVDALLKQVHGDLANRMEKNTDHVSPGLNYILVATRLERIGDYVTNICERIVFMVTAKSVDLN